MKLSENYRTESYIKQTNQAETAVITKALLRITYKYV